MTLEQALDAYPFADEESFRAGWAAALKALTHQAAPESSHYGIPHWDDRAGLTESESLMADQDYWDSRGGSPF